VKRRDDLPVVTPKGELQSEPPVVARMIVEIRSDGSRTIARGALEDVATGHKSAIEAHGTTPIQLAFSLVRSLGQLPRFALRGLLRNRLKP
jgi:ABC-type arginine transport system permease subunit